MKKNLNDVLDECLHELATGEATLETCLARHPEHADDLRHLLTVAASLSTPPDLQTPPRFKAATRAALIAHMHDQPRQGWRTWLSGLTLQPYRLAFTLAAVTFLLLTTTTIFAQNSLPGQPLYGWKVSSETVWRAIHPDPLAVDLAIARRRAAELRQVMGDPTAEADARKQYESALGELTTYEAQEDEAAIYEALVSQQTTLDEAGLHIATLDHLLTTLSSELPPTEPTPLVTPVDTPQPTPTLQPTEPAGLPTTAPTVVPSTIPTIPAVDPTELPDPLPTALPTIEVTVVPPTVDTPVPTLVPTEAATLLPTLESTAVPTLPPLLTPTAFATLTPTATATPVATEIVPTEIVTIVPTVDLDLTLTPPPILPSLTPDLP